ncbi:hypothetical protein BDZ88DRAFT_145397 [Geranomyces variabilis]|nr:hypothetical protein BDZ88DRAFT_145397 [Geranomyces variabilis]
MGEFWGFSFFSFLFNFLSFCTALVASSLGVWYAERQRGKPLRRGTAGIVVALSTLTVSQLVIHGAYVQARNDVIFQNRRDAMARAEKRRMREFGWGDPDAED